jgi:hypothetical protein
MKVFNGIVTGGYGIATRNLGPIMSLIESRTGLAKLAQGTLNVNISEEYIARPDALISPDEYPYMWFWANSVCPSDKQSIRH